MAINERLVHTASAAAGNAGEEGLILHLDANDVDSFDGDGNVWYDIHDHEYTPTTNVSEHFNTVTYTGSGDTTNGQSITGVGFQPDLVWIKSTGTTYNHVIYDSIRGVNSAISSNLTDVAWTNRNRFESFDSDGFTIEADNNADLWKIDRAGEPYVAWCFNAGGNEVTNTDGTINTTVRANNNLGFSIATYTGVGYPNSTTAEIGHGLDSAPELVIIKGYGGTGQSGGAGSWTVGSSLLGSGWDGGMYLNSTGAYYNAVNYFWNGAATGSVIKLKNDWFVNGANNNYVAYSFASKRGVSKVGSYIGDGTTNNKIHTEFEPAFIIIKRTDSTSNWRVFDNVRGTQKELYANDTAQEPSDVSYITFNRDGFTLTSNGGWINNSGGNFIYYAVAKYTNETQLADTVGFKPSIDPDDHFNTVLYTGDGTNDSTKSITGVGFTPDFVWIKNRDTGSNHYVTDSVRGDNKHIYTESTSIENGNSVSSYGGVLLNSDGFTVNKGTNSSSVGTNATGDDYVAWCFNAGGSEVTNTEGTVDSTVRANNDLGFSIVKYNGLSTAVTAGHGLDSPPDMVICKPLVTGAWAVWHKDMASDLDKNYIPLTTGTVTANASSLWNYSNWGATKIGSSNPLMFGTNNDIVAYCFTSKRGVSKVGSYIGTGVSGNKIYTEFEPAFVMVKNIDDAGSWLMYDNARDTDGVLSEILYADTTAQEVSATTATITPNRDGFTIGNSNSIHLNRSGNTFIYYAVAKNTNNEQPHLKLNLEADSYSGSGNWLDSSGNGNNGTITGATWEKELGNFFEFNGSSDKVEGSISGIGSQFTVELWVSPNDFTGNENLFELYDSATAASNNRIFFSGGSLLASKNGGGGGFAQKTSITSVMTIGKWHHVVARYDSNSSIKLYVDTVKVAEDLSVSGTFNIANFAIGVNNDYTQGERNFANAKIGQVRVYDTILTEAQIRQNFNFTKPKYPNEFHGDITGATWNASGYFDFDGSNDNVSITSTANSPIDFTAKNYTITAWINPDTSGVNQIFTKYGSSDSLRSVSVLIHSDNKLRLIQRTSTSDNSYSTSTISQNTWTHIAVTRSSSDVKFYINGQLDNTVSNTFTPNSGGSQDVMIGANGSGTPSYFNGQISKVKAYNAVLTQAEIDALYGEGY